MKNFTNENLINIAPSGVTPGTLAIKIGDKVFVARKPSGNASTPIISGGLLIIPAGTVESEFEYPYTETTINVTSPVTVEGTVDQQISQVQLSATVSNGGTPTFSSISGLIDGLSMTSGGLITGTPTSTYSGSKDIVVSYMNISGQITINYSIAAAGGGGGGGGYVVTNAGNNDYNGTYNETGQQTTFDAVTFYPVYQNQITGKYLVWQYFGMEGSIIYGVEYGWVFCDNWESPMSNMIYYNSTYDTNPSNGSWSTLDLSASPSPTVTAG